MLLRSLINRPAPELNFRLYYERPNIARKTHGTNVLIALLNEVALRSKNFLSLLYPPPPPAPVDAVRLVAFHPSDIILFMSIKVAGWGFSGGEHLPGLSINYVAINKDMEK